MTQPTYRICWSRKTSTRNCWMVLYTQKLRNVGKTIIINHPFGNGVDHLFMVIWGMVYCCFNHIACLGSFVPQFDPHHQCSVKAFHSVGIPCADGRSVHARLRRAWFLHFRVLIYKEIQQWDLCTINFPDNGWLNRVKSCCFPFWIVVSHFFSVFYGQQRFGMAGSGNVDRDTAAGGEEF